MTQIQVVLHMDTNASDSRRISWWADSPDVDGWTAGAETLVELTKQVENGVAFYFETVDIDVVYMMAESVPGTEGPKVEITDPNDGEQVPPSRGVSVSQLVSA